MAALGSLVVQLGLNYAQFTAGLSKSEQDALSTAKRVQDSMDAVGTKVAEVAGAIAGGIAAGFTINAFKGLISGTIESAAALHDLEIQTGASVEALSGLASVGKYSGQTADSIADAMGKLAKNLASATEEGKGASAGLRAIGLSAAELRKQSPDQQLVTLAQALDKYADGSGKAAVAQAELGKEGAKMLPFLKDLAVAGELQGKLTSEQAAAADNLDDNLTRLRGTSDAWKKDLALGMIPALDQAVQAFLQVSNGTGGLRAEIKKLSAEGTIAEWTRNVISGFSYVVQAGEGVVTVMRAVGTVIGGVLAANAATLGSVSDAVGKVTSGDLKGAWASLQDGEARRKAIVGDMGADLDKLFNQKSRALEFRDALGAIASKAPELAAAKKQVNFAPDLEKDKNAAAAAADALAAIIAKLQGLDKLQVNETKQSVADIASARKRGALSDIEAIDATADAEIASLNASKLNLQQQLVIYQGKKNGAKDVATTQAKIDEDSQAIANRERQRNRDLGDSYAALQAEQEKSYESRLKDTDALSTQLYDLQQEALGIGATAARLRDLTMARAEELAVAKERKAVTADSLNALGETSAEGDQLREQAKLIREIAGQQGKNGIAKEAADSWKSFTDSLYNGLTDSLFRAFESGGKFFSTFWAGIKNTFKTTVLKLAIQGVVSLALSSLGINTAAAGLNILGGGAGGSGTSPVSAIGTGSSLANLFGGTSAIGAAAGNFGFGASTGLGLTLSGNTGAALNLAYGNLIGEGGAGAAAGAGTAFGAIAPYAAAAAILYEAFKSGSRVNTNSGYNLGFSGKDLGAAGFDISKVVGGGFLTGGDKERTDYFKLPDAMQAQFQKTASDFTGQLSGLLSGVGIDFNKQISGFVEKAFDLGVGGLSAEDAAKVVANYFGEVQERMAQYILGDGAGGFGKAGETAVQTIARLSQSLQAVNPVLALLGQRVLDVSLKGGDAASQLIDLVGGLDNFNNATKDYYQNYYSDAERAANSTEAVRATLAAVGVQMPATREQFRKLVEAQDLTTTSGRAAEAALLGVEGVFADLVPAAQTVAETLGAATDTYTAAQGNLRTAYDNQVSSIQASIDKMQGYVDSLRKFRQELTTGAAALLSPEAQYNAAKSQFESVSAAAATGDTDALDSLQDVSQAYLDASKDYYASSESYFADLSEVKDAVQASQNFAAASVDVGKLQLSATRQLVSGFLDLDDTLQDLPEALAVAISAYLGVKAAGGTPTGGTGGGASDSALITAAYGGYLDRAPETGAVQYYLDLINTGQATREQVVDIIKNSAEAQQVNGSHATGLAYVPFDNYIARLHKGERVVPAAQNWLGSGLGGNLDAYSIGGDAESKALQRQILAEQTRANEIAQAALQVAQSAAVQTIAAQQQGNEALRQMAAAQQLAEAAR